MRTLSCLPAVLLAACRCTTGFKQNVSIVAQRDGADISFAGAWQSTDGAHGNFGAVFVDTRLCLKDLTNVHVVEVRTSSGKPLTSLKLLLLRPSSEALGSFEVVAALGLLPLREDDSHSTYLGGTRLEGSLPADSAAAITLSPILSGEEGDCLGWYQEAGSTGGIARRPRGPGASSSDGMRVVTVEKTSLLSAPQLGMQLSFEGDGVTSGYEYSVGWRVAVRPRELQEMPRPRRLRALREMMATVGNLPGLTSVAYKRDLIKLFGSPVWADLSIIEVGTCQGGTAMILSMLSALVYAVEIHSSNVKVASKQHLRGLRNVVYLTLDSGRPYAFSMLDGNINLRAAVIDGEHSRQNVFRDTFNVLHDIDCCIHTVIYHDYCDQTVFETVQLFVKANVLRFRRGIGDEPGVFWWCSEGRPEGAVFDVFLDAGMRYRLETLERDFAGVGSLKSASETWDGSTWLLDRNFVLTLNMAPAIALVHSLRGGDGYSEFGIVHLEGWRHGSIDERWGMSTLHAAIWKVGQDHQSACAQITFDPQMTGFTLAFIDPSDRCGSGSWSNAVMVGLRLASTQSLFVDANERSTPS